ncbi:PIN domain-containing protein [Patescibacteria group bacterium]|nr:PIN domain-containing protein [Patescibacteria group bacterium]
MKIRIVVDANIIISALLGGKPRFILFDSKFEFITVEFTLKEVEKHIPLISEKSRISEKEIREGINLLPLKIIATLECQDYFKEAAEIMKDIDKNDIEILALYLKEKTYLWSEDKHFEKAKKRIEINLLKTENFL